MNTNFLFLKEHWPELFDRASKSEQLVVTDPRTSLTYARMALELAVNWLYNEDKDLQLPFDKTLNSLINQPAFKQKFTYNQYQEIRLIKKYGNLAVHNRPVSDIDSNNAIINLFYLLKFVARSYGPDELLVPGPFDWNLVPDEGPEALSKLEIKKLQANFDKKLDKYQSDIEASNQRIQELAAANELLQRQLAEKQAHIEEKSKKAQLEDIHEYPRNEAETRRQFIDIALREAGWDLQGANDKEFKVEYMPKSTNKSGIGYVDYVLWDDDGKPLALVEAKSTMENATKGENQAQLYADCLEKMFGRRPIMFYTNGFETYIWDDQFYKVARRIHGFYTKAELQTAMFRRTHRKDIRQATIDTTIAGRSYQMRSIRSIAEHFAGNDKSSGKLIGTNRGALLVLATGTGKTRTAIALSKMLFESNWVKRVLFLADRKSLVSQAKRNFVKFLPEHKSVNLLEEKDNPEARLAFSTYQTMMGLIDEIQAGERYYGVGHFDLVIIDEAHRSIYKKYQAIFEYFDALFLGLTATPKNSIDKNTYEVFGLPDKTPTDAYTFEEAVENGHLVPYRTLKVPTKFRTEGIKYSELSEEEKEEFEREILDGEEATGSEWISQSELDTWLFNKDTAIKTLRYVLEHGIRKRGGDEIGKTIVFARNKKHALFLKDMLMELDKERFSNDYVKVITHGEPKAEEFIQRFCDEEKERLPQIVISVDMMDTGIDAPSCVNLVFYKPVKSFAKFWQMIGRGSRLRPNLFGEGEDKECFYIFDLCGNFEFFDENPHGIESSIQKSLTETVFNLKLDLAQHLKHASFADDMDLQAFRTELLDDLHQEIAGLDQNRFDVKMKLKYVLDYGGENRSVWTHLDKSDINRIKADLAPLIRPKQGDTDLARFYDKLLYQLMVSRLTTPNAEQFEKGYRQAITRVRRVSQKLLKKMNIPEVKNAKDLIEIPLTETFWKKEGLNHLEAIRVGIRSLIQYIDREDQKYVTTNFTDEILEDEKGEDIIRDPEEDYKTPFVNNVHRLQKIIRENKDHITISRIRRGKQITREELQSLETLLFSNGVEKSGLEKELGKSLNLVEFIVSLMGLSADGVDQAFAQFINDYQLNSVQIQFLDTIKEFLTDNGQINPLKLYDPPFKSFHSQGVDGVFNGEQRDKIFHILDRFKTDDSHTA